MFFLQLHLVGWEMNSLILKGVQVPLAEPWTLVYDWEFGV